MAYFSSQKGGLGGEKPVDQNDPPKVQHSQAKTKPEALDKERNLSGRDRNIHPRYSNSSASSGDGSLKAGTIGSHPSELQWEARGTHIGSDRGMETSLNRRTQEKVPMSPARQRGGLSPSNRVFSPKTPVRSKLSSRDERVSDNNRAVPPLRGGDQEDSKGEQLTGIFRGVSHGREENTERVPRLEVDTKHRHPQTDDVDSGCWCFCLRRH